MSMREAGWSESFACLSVPRRAFDAQKVYEAFSVDKRELVDLGHEVMLSPALLLRFVGASQRMASSRSLWRVGMG